MVAINNNIIVYNFNPSTLNCKQTFFVFLQILWEKMSQKQQFAYIAKKITIISTVLRAKNTCVPINAIIE